METNFKIGIYLIFFAVITYYRTILNINTLGDLGETLPSAQCTTYMTHLHHIEG